MATICVKCGCSVVHGEQHESGDWYKVCTLCLSVKLLYLSYSPNYPQLDIECLGKEDYLLLEEEMVEIAVQEIMSSWNRNTAPNADILHQLKILCDLLDDLNIDSEFLRECLS